MANTDGSGSGSGTGFSFSSVLNDLTQVGMSYAAARGLDVNGAHGETVPGVENGYYGYGSPAGAPPGGSSGSSGLLIVGIIAALGVAAFVLLKKG